MVDFPAEITDSREPQTENSDFPVQDENWERQALASRLRAAIKAAGGNRVVAARSRIPSSTLGGYLAGGEIKLSKLVALADATGTSLEWLVHGRGPMEREGSQPSDDQHMSVPVSETGHQYVAIPRWNVLASAGGGALADNPQIVEYMAYDEHFLSTKLRRSAKYLLLVEARGDSMEPTIRDGDVLTVDITPGQTIEHGALYVLRVGENLLVKRVEQRLHSVVLHSENPRYDPEAVARDELDQLHILGQVLLISAPPR